MTFNNSLYLDLSSKIGVYTFSILHTIASTSTRTDGQTPDLKLDSSCTVDQFSMNSYSCVVTNDIATITINSLDGISSTLNTLNVNLKIPSGQDLAGMTYEITPTLQIPQ